MGKRKKRAVRAANKRNEKAIREFTPKKRTEKRPRIPDKRAWTPIRICTSLGEVLRASGVV